MRKKKNKQSKFDDSYECRELTIKTCWLIKKILKIDFRQEKSLIQKIKFGSKTGKKKEKEKKAAQYFCVIKFTKDWTRPIPPLKETT